jgi:hypothetical protein
MRYVGCRIVTFALIVGLAVGCTSEAPHPAPSATPSTHATSVSMSSHSEATPSRTGPLTTGPNVRPGEKPPEYPALAREHTANGALAFAGYYYAAFDWGYATNDPYLVNEISTPRCVGCQKYINGLRNVRAAGGVLRGGRIDVVDRSLAHGDFNYRSDFVGRFVINEEAIVIERSNGRRKFAAPGYTNYIQYVFVSWRRSRWWVTAVAGD